MVDGKPATVPTAPEILDGRTMVPLRFVAESLGARLKWFGVDKPMVITLERAIAPTVATTPAGSDSGVFPVVSATFDREMDGDSLIKAMHVTTGGQDVPGEATYDADARTVYFVPDRPFRFGAGYLATIDATAADADGVTLAQPIQWQFATGAAPEGAAFVSGIVTGPGGPVEGVPVSAGGDSGTKAMTLTNSQGQYRLQLTEGSWTLRADATAPGGGDGSGAAPTASQAVTLTAGGEVSQDLNLTPATAAAQSKVAFDAAFVSGSKVVTLDPHGLTKLLNPALTQTPLEAATPYGLYDLDPQGNPPVEVYPDRPTLIYLLAGDTQVAAVIVDPALGDQVTLTPTDVARGLLFLGSGLMLTDEKEQRAHWADILNASGVPALADALTANLPLLPQGISQPGPALAKAIRDALMSLPQPTDESPSPDSSDGSGTSGGGGGGTGSAGTGTGSAANRSAALLPAWMRPVAIARPLAMAAPASLGPAVADIVGSTQIGKSTAENLSFKGSLSPQTFQSGLKVTFDAIDPTQLQVDNVFMRYVRLRVTKVYPNRAPQGGDMLVDAVPWFSCMNQIGHGLGSYSNPEATLQVTPDYKQTARYEINLRGPSIQNGLALDMTGQDMLYNDAVLKTVGEYMVKPVISTLPESTFGGEETKMAVGAVTDIAKSALASPDFRAAVQSRKPEYIAQEVVNIIFQHWKGVFEDETLNAGRLHSPLVHLAKARYGASGASWMQQLLAKTGLLGALSDIKEDLLSASAPVLVGGLQAVLLSRPEATWTATITPLGRQLKLEPDTITLQPGQSKSIQARLLLANGIESSLPAGGSIAWSTIRAA